MILIALIIQQLSHYLPGLLKSGRIDAKDSKFGAGNVVSNLRGLITCFVLSFSLITIVVLTTTTTYLLNKDAIYGIQASPLAKELGFMNGDFIVSINDQTPHKFNDIHSIIMRGSYSDITVLRDNEELNITLENVSLSYGEILFSPREATDGSGIPLSFTTERLDFKQAINCYVGMVSDIYYLFVPQQIMSSITVYDSSTLKGLMLSLSYHLIFLGLINLIPFPGLAMGNLIMIGFQKMINKSIPTLGLIIIKITGIIITGIVVTMLIFP